MNQEPQVYLMSQASYEAILACIQHGAAAQAKQLTHEFNMTCELANRFVQAQNAAREKKQQQSSIDEQANALKQQAQAAAPKPAPATTPNKK